MAADSPAWTRSNPSTRLALVSDIPAGESRCCHRSGRVRQGTQRSDRLTTVHVTVREAVAGGTWPSLRVTGYLAAVV